MPEKSKTYEKSAPRVYIRTFGCQMNDRDSELVAGLLIKKGYKLASSPEKADIILLNTCSVRQKAEDKVWSEIGKLKSKKSSSLMARGSSKKTMNYELSAKSYRRKPIIGLIGCMAQEWQQAAFNKSPLIDLVVGPNNINSIPGLLDDLHAGYGRALAVGKEQRDAFVYNTEYIAEKSHCNVNIMTGCNNYCSYCIVPYVRGKEHSRRVEEIIEEIKALIKKGVKEITLLGQNVNSYSSQAASRKPQDQKSNTNNKYLKPEACSLQLVTFIDLLRLVNEIKGLKKFDFVTSHPKDANEKLFKTMAELSKCKKFLHLPVQSGSDRMLTLMNRGYKRNYYIDLVKKAKKIIPGLRLTTDVMVGFPTETNKDFKDTFDLMKEVEFDAAYIFKYSPRPRTKAAELSDDVPTEVKKKRNKILLEFQKQLHKSKQR